MRHLLAFLSLILLSLNVSQAQAQEIPVCTPFDNNGDDIIGISDLMDLLARFGDSDLDHDGIWDSVDDCYGVIDSCGVCAGNGVLPGYCDCELNVLDAIGVCGGQCALDADNDGVCDDEDWCIGVTDTCGVCNGTGAELTTQSILAGDSVLHNGSWLTATNDTIIEIWTCPPVGCTDSIALNFDPIAQFENGTCDYPLIFTHSYSVEGTTGNGKLGCQVEMSDDGLAVAGAAPLVAGSDGATFAGAITLWSIEDGELNQVGIPVVGLEFGRAFGKNPFHVLDSLKGFCASSLGPNFNDGTSRLVIRENNNWIDEFSFDGTPCSRLGSDSWVNATLDTMIIVASNNIIDACSGGEVQIHFMRKSAEGWIEYDLIQSWGYEAQIEVLSSPNDFLLLTAETFGVSLSRFTKSNEGLWTSNWISTIATDDYYSESLAVSPNKQWAAFGAGAVSTSEHFRAGAVNVFQVTDSTITQLGETIRGDTLAAYLGESVAISDGGRLFAGAPQHGQLAQYYPYTQGKGRVEVYDWNTDDEEWQRTSLIHGLTWPERFGCAVDCNAEGTTFVSGAYVFGPTYNSNYGAVRLYQLTEQ